MDFNLIMPSSSEQLAKKREFIYSLISVVLSLIIFLLHYSELKNGELISDITVLEELPLRSFIGIVVCEGIKLGLIFYIFCPTPISHQISSSSYSGSSGHRKQASISKFGRISEAGAIIWQMILSCLVCYTFVILFGAPLLSKFILTAQFSIILTSWIFTPLCLIYNAKDILKQVIYFSTWNTKQASISRAKLRIISTIGGALVGSIFIPLDWDRPWQVWPLPLLFSSFLINSLVNTGAVLYFLWGYLDLEESVVPNFLRRGSSKTKNY